MRRWSREVVRCGLICAAFVMVCTTACTTPPVDWGSDRTVTAPATASALVSAGLGSDSIVASQGLRAPPPPVCPGSVRAARAGRRVFAVWWAPRRDSLARLVSASTVDGGSTWSRVVPVDTTDRGATGCHREAPAVAADSTTGYVHVTYGMVAPEGPGLFFSHSMDGGATFHSPVPILYGERPGRTSVASSGDFVVVAFEDPNSTIPRVGLAISRTMGHIFEDRLLPVSDDNGAASRPQVAVRRHRVSVAWQERVAANGDAILRIRTGTLH